MKKQFLISILTGTLLVTGAAQAASWQESLSSAASGLTKESGSSQGGLSASSLTGLLSNSSQSLSAGTMNNAAGILEYCAKQKLASVTDTENIKNQVLGKLGLDTQEQKADTNYMDDRLPFSATTRRVYYVSLTPRREVRFFIPCHHLSLRIPRCDCIQKSDFINQILTTAHFRDTKIAAKRHRNYIVLPKK